MIAVDASVAIALLSIPDRHHVAAVRFIGSAAPESLLMHPLTLAEVLVGASRDGRAQAAREDIRVVGILVGPMDQDAPLRLAALRAGSGLRLPDCCVLDVAQVHGAAVATFDHALAWTARRLGLATAV